MANNKPRKTTNKKIPPKGKLYSSEYQPSPEAKSLGWKKKKAQNIVLGAILKEVTESMTDIKVKGKFKDNTSTKSRKALWLTAIWTTHQSF